MAPSSRPAPSRSSGYSSASSCGPTPSKPTSRVQETLGISERELEVLKLLAAGGSNKEIAKRLDVSPNTVKTHVTKLFAKLQARRRTEAIQKARELGVIT